MISNLGKTPTEVTSNRPTSLLPIMAKVFVRLLLSRIEEAVALYELIPLHQFGFSENHLPEQQGHRIIYKTRDIQQAKKKCTSISLNVQQALDKAWQEVLLYKLKSKVPNQLYLVLKSYLKERRFPVKTDDTLSDYHFIKAGVPQENIIGPLLYLIYTADAPTRDDTLTATFADDTAILSSDADPARASERLHHLSLLQNCLKIENKGKRLNVPK
jgi:hypothetical protein